MPAEPAKISKTWSWAENSRGSALRRPVNRWSNEKADPAATSAESHIQTDHAAGLALPRFNHQDYAWALNKLRRAGITPTLVAIAREIAQRDGESPAGHPTEAPAPLRPAREPVARGDWNVSRRELADPAREEELAAQIRQLRSQLERELCDRRDLEAELQQARSRQEKLSLLEVAVQQAHQAEESSRRRETALRAELDNLRLEAEQTRKEAQAVLEAREMELKAARSSEAEARARIADLERQLEEAHVDGVLTASMENLIQEQKLSLESTTLRVQALTEKLKEASAKASRVDGLESALVALQAEVEAWQLRERTWREELASEKAARQTAEHQLQQTLTHLESEVQTQITQAREQARNEALNQARSEFEQELSARLAAQRTARPQAAVSLEDWQKACARLAELEPLPAKLEILQQENAAWQTRLQELAAEQTILRESRQKLLQQLEAARKDAALASAELSRLQSELAASHQAAQQLETELAQARATAASLSENAAALAPLQEKITALETQLTEASSAQAALASQLQAAEAQLAASRESSQKFQDQLAASTSAIAELQDKLQASEAERTALQERIRSLQEESLSSAPTVQSLQAQLAAAEQSQVALEKQLHALREKATPDLEHHRTLLKQLAESRQREAYLEAQIASFSSLHQRIAEQTALAESQKTAIQLLQKKLLSAENELIALRQGAPPRLPAPAKPAPTPSNPATAPAISTPADPPQKRFPRWLAVFLALAAVGGATLGWVGPTLIPHVRALFAPPTASEPVAAPPPAQPQQNATTESAAPPTTKTAPAPAELDELLLLEDSTASPNRLPLQLAPASARTPATEWNSGQDSSLPDLNQLFNPAGQLDFYLLQRIWEESNRGTLAPRSWDDSIPEVRPDYDDILRLANEGDAHAQYVFALRLMVDAFAGHRRGVDGSDSLREAYQWMQKSARSGNPDALYIGGQMRRLGIGGTADPRKGLAVIGFAARAGQADAQEFLGVEFLNWYFQTKLSEHARTSAENFRAAAEQGRPLGELMLGRMLTEGLGVEQNTAEGVKWLHQAYQHGKPEARIYLEDAAAAGSEEAQAVLAELEVAPRQ